MDPTQPSGNIAPQPLTNAVTTSDATLVDDTVRLVDDSTALVGGRTTPIANFKVSVIPDKPNGSTKILH